MSTTNRSTALALLLLVPVSGWRDPAEQLTLHAHSRVWVEGTSTIRSFICKADRVDALVETKSANAIPQLLAGDKAVVAVDVKVPAANLDCGNGTMNEHMLAALKANESPTILFRLSSYELARAPEAVTSTLRGTLSLGGVQRPMTIVAQGTGEGDMLRVTGATQIRMTDHDLTPPTLMFGRIRVNENVTVKFDLLLKR